MNFVSAKIRLFRIYSIVFAITGAFVLNCALGQPVSSDDAKTATANPNFPGLNELDDSSPETSGSGTYNNRVDEKIFFFLSILKYKKSLTSYSKSNQEPLLGMTLQLNKSLPLA